MALNWAGRLAGMLLLAGALTGCIDAKVDVNVTSMTTAKAVMTQVMAPEFYDMVKTNVAQARATAPDSDEFCAQGELSENHDGSATCVLTEEGPFATLSLGHEHPAILFAPAGTGLVRVALSIADIKSQIGLDEAMDEDTRQMVEAFFKDHSITLQFSGREVTETNMTRSADKRSAEQVIPFLDLINGTAPLPAELYAVVRVE